MNRYLNLANNEIPMVVPHHTCRDCGDSFRKDTMYVAYGSIDLHGCLMDPNYYCEGCFEPKDDAHVSYWKMELR